MRARKRYIAKGYCMRRERIEENFSRGEIGENTCAMMSNFLLLFRVCVYARFYTGIFFMHSHTICIYFCRGGAIYACTAGNAETPLYS